MKVKKFGFGSSTFLLATIGIMLSFAPIAKAESEAVQTNSCATQPGYPLGRWTVSVQNATEANYSTFVTFTTPTSGTWLPSTGTGSFTTSSVPAPGKEIILIHRDDQYTDYSSKNKLVVSHDGCHMSGTFLDSQGHRGEARYRWTGE